MARSRMLTQRCPIHVGHLTVSSLVGGGFKTCREVLKPSGGFKTCEWGNAIDLCAYCRVEWN